MDVDSVHSFIQDLERSSGLRIRQPTQKGFNKAPQVVLSPLFQDVALSNKRSSKASRDQLRTPALSSAGDTASLSRSISIELGSSAGEFRRPRAHSSQTPVVRASPLPFRPMTTEPLVPSQPQRGRPHTTEYAPFSTAPTKAAEFGASDRRRGGADGRFALAQLGVDLKQMASEYALGGAGAEAAAPSVNVATHQRATSPAHGVVGSFQPASRSDVQQLRQGLQEAVQLLHAEARKRGRQAVIQAEEQIYAATLNEIIRQVTLQCSDRGSLLRQVLAWYLNQPIIALSMPIIEKLEDTVQTVQKKNETIMKECESAKRASMESVLKLHDKTAELHISEHRISTAQREMAVLTQDLARKEKEMLAHERSEQVERELRHSFQEANQHLSEQTKKKLEVILALRDNLERALATIISLESDNEALVGLVKQLQSSGAKVQADNSILKGLLLEASKGALENRRELEKALSGAEDRRELFEVYLKSVTYDSDDDDEVNRLLAKFNLNKGRAVLSEVENSLEYFRLELEMADEESPSTEELERRRLLTRDEREALIAKRQAAQLQLQKEQELRKKARTAEKARIQARVMSSALCHMACSMPLCHMACLCPVLCCMMLCRVV
jgi:hypothetical protein